MKLLTPSKHVATYCSESLHCKSIVLSFMQESITVTRIGSKINSHVHIYGAECIEKLLCAIDTGTSKFPG